MTATMRAVSLDFDGAAQHVTVAGEGPPALLLHGVPDSAELWDDVIAGLADHHTCYAPDLPGFHRSAVWPGMAYDFDGYADVVTRHVDGLGITEPVTLIIHDWGGIFGLCWACAHPDRVARIVAMDFPFSHLYRWHFWAQQWRTPVLGEIAMAAMNWPLFRHEMRRGSRKLSDAHIRRTYETSMTAATKRVVLGLYRSADPDRWIPWQPRLQALAAAVPITAIWGGDDPYVPTWCARQLGARDVQVLDGVGHWVPAEAPEAVINAVLTPADASADAA